MAIGLVIVFAISPALSATNNVSDNYYVSKQAIAILMGFAAFLITANLKPQIWRKIEKPVLLLAFGGVNALQCISANELQPKNV